MKKPHRESANERIGRNMRVLRERKGLSQAALAAAMSERGHAWHQQTVTRAESAAQPVKADELIDLAAILGTSLDRFTWTSPEASAVELVYGAGYRARLAWEAVADAVPHLLAALKAAERRALEYRDNPSGRVREASGDTLARITELGLDDAIAEGIRRYEQRGTDGGDGS